MISQSRLITAFDGLGAYLTRFLNNKELAEFESMQNAIDLSFHKNGWFTHDEVEFALAYWANELTRENLEQWVKRYGKNPERPKIVGLVLAGNIPMVGFHDVLCTFLAGHRAVIKCSANDDILIPFLLHWMSGQTEGFEAHFRVEKGLMKTFDAVIATGSNNSARHFEHYFKGVPTIIRRNRTSVAVLTGDESDEELKGLIKDAFQYYGLGCRNVTKIYVPKSFDLDRIFSASMPFAYLSSNKKYFNNVIYHKTLMMMQQKAVLENDLILLVEDSSLFSPVGVLNYEYYDDVADLNSRMESQLDDIQCVVGNKNIPFGKAQHPSLHDYADGVDTMKFLLNL